MVRCSDRRKEGGGWGEERKGESSSGGEEQSGRGCGGGGRTDEWRRNRRDVFRGRPIGAGVTPRVIFRFARGNLRIKSNFVPLLVTW
jgi:hypothetical protein